MTLPTAVDEPEPDPADLEVRLADLACELFLAMAKIRIGSPLEPELLERAHAVARAGARLDDLYRS